MTTLRATLEILLAGDQDLYTQLCEAGFIPRDDSALAPEHLEAARVARTLVHELEVNWAGVEVVLHHERVIHAAVKHTDGTSWLQPGTMLSLRSWEPNST